MFYYKLEWKPEFCETVIEESEENNNEFKTDCLCKELNPTTVISDIENIFSNSDIGKVFSEQGLS